MTNITNTDYKPSTPKYNPHVIRSNDLTALIFENLEWLTSAETAYYLRKTRDAIRQMVHRGQLRARKFHGRLYFKKVELDQALDISFY